jgi:hypothetical protein
LQLKLLTNHGMQSLKRHKNSYNGWRFGHDYDQELMESRALKESLNDFEGKIVIFTWVDDTNPKITRVAMTSQFKSGAIKPVEK